VDALQVSFVMPLRSRKSIERTRCRISEANHWFRRFAQTSLASCLHTERTFTVLEIRCADSSETALIFAGLQLSSRCYTLQQSVTALHLLHQS